MAAGCVVYERIFVSYRWWFQVRAAYSRFLAKRLYRTGCSHTADTKQPTSTDNFTRPLMLVDVNYPAELGFFDKPLVLRCTTFDCCTDEEVIAFPLCHMS